MELHTSQDIAWRPSADMLAQSNLLAFMRSLGVADYDALRQRAAEDMAWFWDAVIRYWDIRFYRPYDVVVDPSRGLPWHAWCVGGTTNVVLNCLDQHLETPVRDQEAVAWEGEDGRRRSWTFAQLDEETCRFAALLRALGFSKGDVIALYVPFVPEATAALLGIAKIGAVVLPLFSGYGTAAVADRLADGGVVAVVTADGTLRRGREVALKAVIDEAAPQVKTLRKVVVIRNRGTAVTMKPGRDHWWDEAAPGDAATHTEPVEADAPLVLAFTSGTTGKAKGAVLTHCGLLTKIALDFGLCFDFKPGDRLLWMSDMGWIVGPITTLCTTFLKGTLVIAEGGPDYPQKGRMWKLVQDHRVSFLGVAPTTIRTLMRHGVEEVEKYDLSSLRIAASTGEPWNRDSWLWCFRNVCKGTVPLHNYIGGTEVSGGILATTVIHPMKPCSFVGPIPGMSADIVDEAGNSLPAGQMGELVLRQPSIGMTRGLWRDPGDRYLDAYWNRLPGMWAHGDFAYRDEDGFWFVPGRSDDTMNVAGKRTGPSEVESLLLATGRVAEAAVVGVPDEVKGTAVVCVCVPAAGETAGAALSEKLSDAVVAGLGKPFRPREIVFVSDVPKTRNMKIMRRVVRAVYAGQPPGDLTALLNPESVEELRTVLAATRR